MKRSNSHFDEIEELLSFSYRNFGNSIQEYTRPYSPDSPLGYCYKYSSSGITIYNVVTSPIGKPETDRRIKAHEYGHIILGHLNGIHEELDSRVLWTINNNRAALIEGINKSLGIDYADKLLKRVIDDPSVNHSLHNIAMDFEVNQQILSSEDVEEMESDISEVMINNSPELQKIKEVLDNQDTSNLSDEEMEKYKKIKEAFDKKIASAKIKLMLPERYHFPDGTPFPKDLTYPDYLMLIVKNLDQFVKMLISIKMGKSGDTMEISDSDLQNELNNNGGQSNSGDGDNDSGEGGSGGMSSFDDLLDSCGISRNGGAGDQYKGCRESPSDTQDGSSFDHSSESRDEADNSRKTGKITSSGGIGCGSSGGSSSKLDPTLESNKDSVDEAIDEVIQNYHSKVCCGFDIKKDMNYLYNRGINRKVLMPVYHLRVKMISTPKIVFLIDVSGSMNSSLVSRILNTISKKMRNIKKGLKYDIITWSTKLRDHFKDLDPFKPSPRIDIGGGTRLAEGIKYFRDNYDQSSILVLISDFEDYLDEWEKETSKMSGYELYGFCYGWSSCDRDIKNFKIRNFRNQ